jgi:2-dehydro-3-deoxyphosphogluconate aldolase/(4S)-4-hydroxy-2-oxoglutarate aldolase
MPTGGVEPSEESLKQWFSAGVTCVGMGTTLITDKLVKAGDWTTLSKNVRSTLDLIKKLK